jgi:hypothetical protein
MRARCKYPSTDFYHDYGGRGITVCDEWQDYLTFKKWALQNGYKAGLTIERKDVNGNYCSDNCEWIPASRQARNRRDSIRLTAFDETKNMHDWLDDPRCKATLSALKQRVRLLDWEHERAIVTPSMRS